MSVACVGRDSMGRSIQLGLAALLCVAASGCGGCGPSPAVEGGECEQKSDCAEGLWCLGRVCQKAPAVHEAHDGGRDATALDTGTDAAQDAALDGATLDGGTDAGTPDGGGPKSVIIPGIGIDYKTATDEHQIRVMQDDYGTVGGILGAGTPNPDIAWYQSYSPHIDALFVDTTDDKNANGGDLLNRLILLEGFNGETAQGHGIGTAQTAWSAETGNPEHSTLLDNGESMDFFFTKGLNLVYDANTNAKVVTVYRPTKVVPDQPIDWNGMSVFGITSAVQSGSSFGEIENTLGSPDVAYTSSIGGVDTETWPYLSLGLSFMHTEQAQSDVNTIAIYTPYFGKLQGTSLGIGSTHAEIKAYFDSMKKEKSQALWIFTIYYYEIKEELVPPITFNICLGFIYNSSDEVAMILVGYPIQK